MPFALLSVEKFILAIKINRLIESSLQILEQRKTLEYNGKIWICFVVDNQIQFAVNDSNIKKATTHTQRRIQEKGSSCLGKKIAAPLFILEMDAFALLLYWLLAGTLYNIIYGYLLKRRNLFQATMGHLIYSVLCFCRSLAVSFQRGECKKTPHWIQHYV